MARINIDILSISKLKWTGMGEFNSDDYHIYYCGQESRRRNGVALIVNKRVGKAILGPFNIAVIQVYAPTTDAEEAGINQF